MKPIQLYQELKNLAEKLDVTVTEQNFRNTGIPVRSGYCIVKNQNYCIIDKHIKLDKKIDILATCISHYSYDGIYLLPAVREFLEKYGQNRPWEDDDVADDSDETEG